MDPFTAVEQLSRRLDALEERVVQLEKPSGGDNLKPASRKKISTKEFILEKKPKNDVQRTLAIGFFLERHLGYHSFNIKDLKKGFREAKENVPANINDKANLNISKGHMMLAEAKKDKLAAWMLTNSGEQYVERGFTEKK